MAARIRKKNPEAANKKRKRQTDFLTTNQAHGQAGPVQSGYESPIEETTAGFRGKWVRKRKSRAVYKSYSTTHDEELKRSRSKHAPRRRKLPDTSET